MSVSRDVVEILTESKRKSEPGNIKVVAKILSLSGKTKLLSLLELTSKILSHQDRKRLSFRTSGNLSKFFANSENA